MHFHGGESTYQATVWAFSSEQIPVTLSALPNNAVDLPFVLVQWIHSELSPCDRRNARAWSRPATETCVYFFCRGEFCVFHCMLCRFVSRSYWKHQVSSPYQTSLHCVKDQMKCEADGVSDHVSRFEAPLLRKNFSKNKTRQNTNNMNKGESVEITNKMQPCNRIYYSNVYWRLNMFRAACRLSSGALNSICNFWFTYPCGNRPLSRPSGKWIRVILTVSIDRNMCSLK